MTASDDFDFCIEDVFHLSGRRVPIVVGELRAGRVGRGDEVIVIDANGRGEERGVVVGVELHTKTEDQLGLMIDGISAPLLVPGSIVRAA